MSLQKINVLKDLDDTINFMVENIDKYRRARADFTRERKLNATITLKLILNMKGNSLNAELMEVFPDIKERVTASAFEQAKGKLGPEIFEDMLQMFNKTEKHKKLLDGEYQVYAIDGSDFSIPSGGIIHANFLYDLESCTYQDCVLQVDERDAAIDMVKRIDNGLPFIVIMDRGYDGFNMIETLNRTNNCYYIIRTKTGKGGIREIMNLPNKECDVEMTFHITTSKHYYRLNKKMQDLHLIKTVKTPHKGYYSPSTRYKRWDFGTFCDVNCRVVKFRINDEGTGKEEWEVLLTNLDCFEFSIRRMKSMYYKRWGIETSFRKLKYALGCINFHSRKDAFIKMELFAHLIMFNVVSRSIAIVEFSQVNRKYPYIIDFKMACLIVRKYFSLHCDKPPDMMLVELQSYLNPVRKGRKDKRSVRPTNATYFTYRIA